MGTSNDDSAARLRFSHLKDLRSSNIVANSFGLIGDDELLEADHSRHVVLQGGEL